MSRGSEAMRVDEQVAEAILLCYASSLREAAARLFAPITVPAGFRGQMRRSYRAGVEEQRKLNLAADLARFDGARFRLDEVIYDNQQQVAYERRRPVLDPRLAALGVDPEIVAICERR